MSKRHSAAGGIFLMAGFVGGFFYGLAAQDVVRWSLVGLGIGIAAALLVWLRDKRR